MQGDPSLHAEQVAELRHMNKVTEPLNWVLCLVCSEDRVIEHYTQIKGLTRGQAIVQWVWHLLICEDDIFTFLLFFFWLRSGKADSLGHYCLQMMSFVSVRFSFYWVTLQNGIIWSLTFHRLAVQHLCSHLGISKQKKLFGSYFIGRLFAIPCLPSINFHSKLLRVHITLSPLRNSEMFRIWLSKHQGLPSCPLSLWNCIFHLPLIFSVLPTSRCSRMCYEMFEMMAMAAQCRLLAVFLTYLNACKSVSIICGLFFNRNKGKMVCSVVFWIASWNSCTMA